MIDHNTPITGAVLEDLREHLGLTTTDFAWMFGLVMYKWTQMKSTDEKKRNPTTGLLPANDPSLVDPSVALYARWLFRHPDAVPIPRLPDVTEVFNNLNDHRRAEGKPEIPRKSLALAMGRESSAGYRWMMQSSNPPPGVQRIGKAIQDRIEADGSADVWDEWCQVVDEEARVRGIDNVWRVGNWQKPERRAAGEAA